MGPIDEIIYTNRPGGSKLLLIRPTGIDIHSNFSQALLVTTLACRATDVQGHKYVDIIDKLAHFIQKVAGPCHIILSLKTLDYYRASIIQTFHLSEPPLVP